MKTIHFSDQELESMLMMYYDELAEAQQYVEQIQEIIKKLLGKPANEPQKRGRKPRVVKPAAAPVEAAPAPIKKEKKKAAPKKDVKPAAKKKSTEKKRLQEMAASAKLSKAVKKKAAVKAKPAAVKGAPAEANIATEE